MFHQVPVREAFIIVGKKLQALGINAIRAAFRVPRKRFDEITVTVYSALIGKSLPFETARTQLNSVAFVSDTRWLIGALMVCTSCEQQHTQNDGRRTNSRTPTSRLSGLCPVELRVQCLGCVFYLINANVE